MRFTRRARLSAAICTFLIVVGCGGGGGGGGSGSATAPIAPDTQVASQGTVTGFGSIVVDGQHIDDSGAKVSRHDEGGLQDSDAAGTPQLGQRVSVELDANGKATRIHIEPELVGTVSAIDTPGQSITVNGVVVRINTSAASGPITTFAGYTQFGDIQVNDRVEAHAFPVVDNTGHITVQATRIAKAPAAAAIIVTGVVSNKAGDSFNLGTLTVQLAPDAVIVPTGATIENGRRVTVRSNAPIVGGAVTANQVRVRKPSAQSGIVKAAGVVTGYQNATGSFNIDGLAITTGATTTISPQGAVLANNAYALVTGEYDTAANAVRAKTIVIRTVDNAERVSLKGTITSFTSSSSFMVRSVLVDAHSATFDGGTATDLANNVFVEVTGTISDSIVVASKVKIRPLPTDEKIVGDIIGKVTTYDAATRTLTLSLRDGLATFVATLASDAVFGPSGKSAGDLVANVMVRLNGKLENGAFTANRVTILGMSLGGARQIEGIVASVSPTSGTPTSFVVNGATFMVGGGVTLPVGFGVGSRVHVVFTTAGETKTARSVVLDHDDR